MEDISRKQLDRISAILQNHVGTEESVKLANILKKADVVPKLYAYTYFKKVKDEIKSLKYRTKSFDFSDFEALIENIPALNLHSIENPKHLNAVDSILQNGFDREGTFCDFDDSIYHSSRRWGHCQCEGHDEFPEGPMWLFPIYQADEDTRKILESEEWWCRDCSNNSEGWEGEFDISCDMEIDE